MTTRKQIIVGIFAILGLSGICYAYHTNDDNFWKYFDSGFMSIIISWILLVSPYFILSFIGWVILAFVLNAWITSMFFDVTKYGMNQTIFGWVCAGVFAVAGVSYNGIKLYWQNQRNKEMKRCKKDARSKYSVMLKRIEKIESALDVKIGSLDNFLNQLINE